MFTRIPINMGILDSRYQQKIRKGFPQVSYETKSLSLLPAIWTFNLIFPTSQGENAEECQPHTHTSVINILRIFPEAILQLAIPKLFSIINRWSHCRRHAALRFEFPASMWPIKTIIIGQIIWNSIYLNLIFTNWLLFLLMTWV